MDEKSLEHSIDHDILIIERNFDSDELQELLNAILWKFERKNELF